MAKANSLAAVDQLNIIFFGEMDITSAEKRLRVVMAAALQRILLRYYDTIQRSLAYSPFQLDSAAFYAAAAAEFARSYIELFNKQSSKIIVFALLRSTSAMRLTNYSCYH